MSQKNEKTTSHSSDLLNPRQNDRQISKSLQNLKTDSTTSNEDLPDQKKTRTLKHRRSQSQTVVSPQANRKFLTVPELHSGGAGRHGDCGDEDTYLVIRDSAIDIDDIYGGKDKSAPRLLVVSSKIRNSPIIRNAILSNVTYVQYNYDNISLEDLNHLVSQTLGGKKVQSIGFILSCSTAAINLCARDDRVLSKESFADQSCVREFFNSLVSSHLELSPLGTSRLHFLSCTCSQHADVKQLAEEMADVLGVGVSMYKDLAGGDSLSFKRSEENIRTSSAGELYFRLDKLRNWSGRHQQSLAGFEKIRTVGKGAYGAAVLYKKKDDDSLVILKEINMHDLNASERQLALNEVNVLAMLDHPNIISYYDSFEEDGVLMIEIEYADGGTLAQFLSAQEKALEEKDVLSMFQQIVAAIRHIHQHNILHRDLKTDNIFLTKEGIVKVGDFGISKMMSSAQKGALTVLGTPYYISPEMCEGKQYSYKSDIWALGCILYEMACLQKTFEGSNLPALVNKIMKGQFAPVKGNYSQGFKDLIMDMLRKEPEDRPCSNDIMYQRLPELMNQFKEDTSDLEEELLLSGAGNISNKIKIRSVLYYMESATGILTCFTELPPRMKIRQVAVGPDHVIVVTTERQVFTWGEGSKGQLGHGDTVSRSSPELVEALKGKSVSMSCCGDAFSLFISDNGLVLTCGDGSNGCLGHDDWTSTSKPRLIETLLSVDVAAVACGSSHVVAVASDGSVYAWGDNSSGQLGLGNDVSVCHPEQVTISEPVVFREVRCSNDGTMLLSDVGSVFACGRNENNKLGLNNRQGFLMAMKNIFAKTEVEGRNTLTPVRALARHRVVDISMGAHHTAVRIESGHVYTFGRNSEGQLGNGNTKSSNAPVEVKSLSDKLVNRVQCGEHFTVASTRDHELYYWGLRFKLPSQLVAEDNTSRSSTNGSATNMSSVVCKDDIRLESVTPRKGSASRSHSRNPSTTSLNKELCNATAEVTPDPERPSEETERASPSRQTSYESVMSAATDSGLPQTPQEDFNPGFRPLSSVPRRSMSASSRENLKEKEKEKEKEIVRDDSVILLEPVEIIRIEQVNEKVLLGNFFCHGENLFIQLETTAPPPRRKALKKRSLRKRSNNKPMSESSDSQQHTTSSREGGDEYSSEASEIDSRGSIPTWLREELATNHDEGSEVEDTSDQSEDEVRCVVDSSMSSIQINRELTPVKLSMEKLSPRLGVSNKRSGDDQTPRNRTASNSTESTDAGHLSDTSSSEPTLGKGEEPGPVERNAQARILITQKGGKFSPAPGVRTKLSGAPAAKPFPRARTPGKGRGQGQDTVLKERLAARGFVSDVTVKRREKDLLSELEQLKVEKRAAEEKMREMEKEHRQRQDELKHEVQKHAQEREKTLQTEISRLQTALDSQTHTLQDNQQAVQALQVQLNQLQADQRHNYSNGGTPRSATPVTPRGGSSKVCVIN